MSTLAEVKAFQNRERQKRKAGRVGEATTKALAKVGIEAIDRFERSCAKAEYTPTDDAWDLLHNLRGLLTTIRDRR